MKLFLLAFAFLSFNAMASSETICGSKDDRTPSDNPKVARSSAMGSLYGCTVTMIGRSCAITAGHCEVALDRASFNVPTNVNGDPQQSKVEDIYLRDQSYLRAKDDGRGNDWAVIKLNKNEVTGLYPGDVQGWYPVLFNLGPLPIIGEVIRITGYGVDDYNRNKSFTQQTHTGEIDSIGTWMRKATIQHTADTTGGNSGSSIILEKSGEIIGVHSHGGCYASGGTNKGTLIAKNKEFKSAIKECLAWEESL